MMHKCRKTSTEIYNCDYKAQLTASPKVTPTSAETPVCIGCRAEPGTHLKKPDIHHLLMTPKDSSLFKTTVCQWKVGATCKAYL